MITLDIGYVGTKESGATAALFTYLRQKYDKSFIWKIPDIGNKLKPCDGLWINDDGELFMIEVKILKKKEWDDYQKMFVPLMEPLQVMTFEKCTKLGVKCVMLGYSIHTNLYYFEIYKGQS